MMLAIDFKRKNALAYIAADPTDISFVPRQRVSDGAGGFKWSNPPALAPQRWRLITSGNTAVTRRTADGLTVTPELTIMGPWNADIVEGWQFSVEGRLHEVVFVLPDVKHCRLAEVIRRG